MKAHTWFEALHQCQQQGESYVLVTIMTSAGSTPREAGAKMIVTAASQFDTIGGGHLEFEAIKQARALLVKGEHSQQVVSFPLASKLGQCCGGAVKVLFEVMLNHSQTIAIFGAGHVAKALVPILAQLPLQIKWIDSRPELFEDSPTLSNLSCICDDDPVAEMAALPNDSWAVILTHNHQLDYELVEQALKQGNLGFLGMIGSQTKAKRFQTRLAHRDYSPLQIQQMVSPIGELSVQGKRPIEVAVSISAQIINLLNGQVKARPNAQANEQTNIQKTALNTRINEQVKTSI